MKLLSPTPNLQNPGERLCADTSLHVFSVLRLTCKLLRAWSISVTELSVVVWAMGMELGRDDCASFTWNWECCVCVCVYV